MHEVCSDCQQGLITRRRAASFISERETEAVPAAFPGNSAFLNTKGGKWIMLVSEIKQIFLLSGAMGFVFILSHLLQEMCFFSLCGFFLFGVFY